MKFIKKGLTDEIVGDSVPCKFRIEQDAVNVIIDSLINLYSDPIGSVVREAVSNCIDSTRERDLKRDGVIPLEEGEDVKYFSRINTVEVEFMEKNSLLGIEASYVFRDFGVGLSRERVKEMYTVFGRSSKRNTNELIGGFGLGCKAPFAYTDTFYISTRYNGTHYYYILYRTNEGVTMDMLGEEPCDQTNGSEVIVPVKDNKDVRLFTVAVCNQLPFLKGIHFIGMTLPEAFGKMLYEDDNCVIPVIDYDDPFLVIEGVKYKLDIDFSELGFSSSGEEEVLNNLSFGIKFNTGELELVPSREDVIYTDEVKMAIKRKLQEIQKKFSVDFLPSLEKIDDILEFGRVLCNVKSRTHSLEQIQFAFMKAGTPVKVSYKHLPGVFFPPKDMLDVLFGEMSIHRYSKNFSKITKSGWGTEWDKVFNEKHSVYLLDKGEKITSVKNRIIAYERLSSEEKNFYLVKRRGIVDTLFPGTVAGKMTPEEIADICWDRLQCSSHIKKYSDIIIPKKARAGKSGDEPEKGRDSHLQSARSVFVRSAKLTYWNSQRPNEVVFVNNTVAPQSFTGEMIYGYQEEESLLKLFGYISSCREKEAKPKSVVVCKVGHDAPQSLRGNKFTYIKDALIMKHSLIVQYCTCNAIEQAVYKSQHLRMAWSFNKEMYKKYIFLVKYLQRAYWTKNLALDRVKKELLEICTRFKLLDNSILSLAEETTTYANNLGIVHHLQDIKSGWRELSSLEEMSSIIKAHNKLYEYTREYLGYRGVVIDSPEELMAVSQAEDVSEMTLEDLSIELFGSPTTLTGKEEKEEKPKEVEAN